MLVGTNFFRATQSTGHSLDTEHFAFYWEGFAYMTGTAAGTASIHKFAEELSADLPLAASRLKGVYFMCVCDKRLGTRYAFVDSSGLFHAFHSNRHVATSFLELSNLEGLSVDDLDPSALVEFFHFGYIAFGKTFFDSVRRIDPNHIVILAPDGTLRFIQKPLAALDVPPERSFIDFLSSLADTITGERISVDLTGGIDSRLLAVALRYFGVSFEVALSGVAGNADLAIAEQVAHVLGRELHVTYHNMAHLERDLAEIFRLSDGLCDPVNYHRVFQLERERLSRGVTLVLTGTGGELFKDFWWLQDFPFYLSNTPDLKRLYSFRIAPLALKHHYLTHPYQVLSKEYRSSLLTKLSAFVVSGNTQTYDQIYFNFKMREYAGRFLTNTAHLVQCYAPYLDREAVAYGYQLPRSARFFNRFHRDTITRLSPAAAEIPTTEGGVSASSTTGKIIHDLSRYAANKLSRATRKVGQRVLRRSFLRDERPDHPELSLHIRRMLTGRNSLQRLKELHIVSEGMQISDLDDRYLGNILSLDMLTEALHEAVATSPALPA